ncbi:hypothetical protein [Lysobacter enzymogenes]|uniref:Uncharacterized protein n=1 Tax=Lysobacter enzymogenes TaxID=69 RepID=A0A3N2RGQ6_LYSEN|nr:hypothetical protein [Lysobacter enzymogenes]ROU06632.1 hypothetical protein D9T17_13120 [Lysobacter enzymogenes]
MRSTEAAPGARVAPPVAARGAPRELPARCAWCPDLIGCRVRAPVAATVRTSHCDAQSGRRVVVV